MPRNYSRFAFCFAVGLLAACSENSSSGPETPLPPAPGEFESGNPSGASSGDRGEGADTASGPAAGNPSSGAPPAPQSPNGATADGGAERAIEEADVIKIQNGKLYALSRYGGLSVVDVSQRDRLSLLGRHKVIATPFEMYVDGGIVFALYQGLGEYAYDDAAKQWSYYTTSYVVVLDARDPSAISELDRFAVPGDITDSRIVGDVLYVAAFENGQCYGCERDRPRTNIISLNVSDPASVQKVDEISREERLSTWSWQRSLTATDKRLYLAGPTWSNTDRPVGSTIEVFDISDPNGDLKEGASVQITGQIQSRWQMDEYEGVLRVVSQPFQWALTSPPRVETFRVESSLEFSRLGFTTLQLPRPEQLQSARFDGPRGYAITAERIDPLFTIDLSDPAAPRQVGELEMPGWVYHMEPRGDRLLGLGYDQGNREGSITVSLFDVGNLAAPTMIKRVNFGGDWGNLPEDQNRIHKAFNVLESAGLILVPFSGYANERTDENGCDSGTFLSGVQLIDWANDDLALRGVAPGKGQARRGFIVDDRLLTMSDERVESFDITNRDAPATTASLPLAQFVHHTQAAGSKVVRVGSDWWSGVTEIDVTTVAGAGSPSALGRLELPQINENGCSGSWLSQVYSGEDSAYLFYNQYNYNPTTQKERQTSRVVTIDVTNPAAPAVEADAELNFVPSYPSYFIRAVDSGASAVNLGSTFVVANRTYDYETERVRVQTSELKVVDLVDPSAPAVKTVALPSSFGATGLIRSGSVVATSQFQPLDSEFTRLRFYLERLDISDPSAPVLAPRVNIPGSLLAYDAESENALTVDYRTLTFENVTADVCHNTYGSYDFRVPNSTRWEETTPGTCRAAQQTLRLVHIDGDRARILASHELEIGEYVGATATGDDRIFLQVGAGYGGYRGLGGADVAGPYWGWGFTSGMLGLVTIGGLRSGELEVGRLELETGNAWGGTGPIVASGKRAALATGFQGMLTVIDAQDAASPAVAREVEIAGYVYDLDVVGNTVVASLGQDGAATLPLSE